MYQIHINPPPLLEPEETRERVEQVANYVKKKYKVNYAWRGNQLLSRHRDSFVCVYLGDGCIEIKIKLGLLFAPMRSRIERAIRKNLHNVIGDCEGPPAKIMLFEKV